MSQINNSRQVIVPHKLHGQRIDKVLAQLIPEFSRSQLASWLKSGKIIVNQRMPAVLLKPKDKVFSGEIINLALDLSSNDQSIRAVRERNDHKTTWNNQPEAIALTIVYEDEQLLVINKPSGLVIHPGAGNPNHTLVNALLYHAPGLQILPRAGIIHRLDKDTTGLLVVAKTLASYTNLIRQMQNRTIFRHYLTLTQGHIISGGTIDTNYGRHPINRLKMSVREHGKSAITRYLIKKHYQYYTLLDVQLLTGRTHQIRVHMAHINHSVFGDPLYGKQRQSYPTSVAQDLLQVLQQFKRQALHAATLSFNHPITGELLIFNAPLPDDFQELLNNLDKYCV